MEDNMIIELFFERSEHAIVALSEKYGNLCKHIAINLLKNELDAEECVNDAYLGVWNSIPPHRPEKLMPYVCRIVRNLSVKRYHVNTAEKRNSNYDVALDELENCFNISENVESQLGAEELSQRVDDFLRILDRESRVIFVKRYWYGDSIADISKALNKDNHYISVKLHRVRGKLKKQLEKDGIFL